jgi:tripartite-type tricarboxylate transporter receptor subunit TctC
MVADHQVGQHQGRVTAMKKLLTAIVAAAAYVVAAGANAQTYPTRPITLVVPFAAGGATDAIARIMADSLSQTLGQQVVIENVGGAGGMIGSARVARAAPDGYTVLLHQVGLAAGMTLYPNSSFDAEKDLTGIGLVNTSASTIVGRASLPANNMAELVRWMKTPGQITKVAHAGVGAFGHLCGVLFVQEVGAKADQIPYRGGGPALNDVVAGHADLSCLSAAIVAPLVNSGQLKGFGIVGKTRFAGLPAVETMAEAGYKNLDLEFWHIMFAPAGTPRPIIDKVNLALRHALTDAKVKDAFAKAGMELYPAGQETPEIATAMLKSEITRWGDVIRANNIQAQ